MKRVCLDNNILIRGIRGQATPGQEGMINRAQALSDDLDEMEADILVPWWLFPNFLRAYLSRNIPD